MLQAHTSTLIVYSAHCDSSLSFPCFVDIGPLPFPIMSHTTRVGSATMFISASCSCDAVTGDDMPSRPPPPTTLPPVFSAACRHEDGRRAVSECFTSNTLLSRKVGERCCCFTHLQATNARAHDLLVPIRRGLPRRHFGADHRASLHQLLL